MKVAIQAAEFSISNPINSIQNDILADITVAAGFITSNGGLEVIKLKQRKQAKNPC